MCVRGQLGGVACKHNQMGRGHSKEAGSHHKIRVGDGAQTSDFSVAVRAYLRFTASDLCIMLDSKNYKLFSAG